MNPKIGLGVFLIVSSLASSGQPASPDKTSQAMKLINSREPVKAREALQILIAAGNGGNTNAMLALGDYFKKE